VQFIRDGRGRLRRLDCPDGRRCLQYDDDGKLISDTQLAADCAAYG